jgi:hypothetical protein
MGATPNYQCAIIITASTVLLGKQCMEVARVKIASTNEE